jgi:hypothetical protein
MSDNPAAPAQASAPQTGSAHSGRRIADYLATAVLAIGHFGRAIHLNCCGGAALLVIDFALTCWRLVLGRIAWFVPLLGCIAQLALALGCVALEMKAGPIR